MAVVVVVRGGFTISASGRGINQSIVDKLSLSILKVIGSFST